MKRRSVRLVWGISAIALLCSRGAWPFEERLPVTAQVTELLDALIQPRFQKDGGVFGMRRVVKSPGHEEVGALTDLSAWDKQQLARIQALKRDYRVSMLRIQHPPGKFRNGRGLWGNLYEVGGKRSQGNPNPGPVLFPMIGPNVDGEFYGKLRTEALAALPQMHREGAASTSIGAWQVALRPVRATQKSCVGCHRGAKQGDTLGVLVYAVNQTATAATVPPRSARRN